MKNTYKTGWIRSNSIDQMLEAAAETNTTTLDVPPKDGAACIVQYTEMIADDGCTYVKSAKRRHNYSYRHRVPVNGKWLIERTWTGELSRRVSHIEGDKRYMMVQYLKGKEKPPREAEPEKQAPHAQRKQAPTKTRPALSQ